MERELTKFELQLMNILWQKNKAFVHDIITDIPEPKPAYTTVSTMMRILVAKGFASFETQGKSHHYYPLISKKDYTKLFIKSAKENFFDNSAKSMLEFILEQEKLSKSELEQIAALISGKR